MADHSSYEAGTGDGRKNGTENGPWDGRFGERFDDEVSPRMVLGTILGIVLLTVVALVLMLVTIHVALGRMAATDAATTPPTRAAGTAPTPPLPRLQAYPEIELVAFKRQMKQHLEGYGWVDKEADIAHIPIDAAMRLVLEHGVVITSSARNSAAGTAESEPESPAQGGITP
jgi:hypothetical protein